MPTGLTPQKRLLSHPSEKLIRRGGVDIKWNGPKLNKAGIQSFMVTEVVSENEKAQYHISVESLKDLSCTCKILYFHAELCVKNKSFFNVLKSPGFQERVKCLVVDEAHLIKEWYDNCIP
jgi:superfamily II DNA helicase RecQ